MNKILNKYIILTSISIIFSIISFTIVMKPLVVTVMIQNYSEDMEKDIETLKRVFNTKLPQEGDTFSADHVQTAAFLMRNSFKLIRAIQRFEERSPEKGDYDVIILPLEDEDGGTGKYAVYFQSYSDYVQNHYPEIDFKWLLLTYALIIIPFILAVSYYVSKNMMAGTVYLDNVIQRISKGDRDLNIRSLKDSPEFTRLSEAAGRLQKRLKSAEDYKLCQSQDLVHDLKGPIASLFAQIELVELGLVDLDRSRFDIIYFELNEINRMLENMTYLYKLSDPSSRTEMEILDIAVDLLEPLLKRYGSIAESKAKRIHCHHNGGELYGNRDLLIRGIGNLIHNALIHGTGDEVWIAIEGEEERLSFIVSNQSHLKREELPSLFARFHQKDRSAKGEGLGLSISGSIAEIHQGGLSAHVNDSGIVSFVFTLLQNEGRSELTGR